MKKQTFFRRALCLAAAGLTAGSLCSACDNIYGDTSLIDIYGNKDGTLNWVGEIVEDGGSKRGSGNVVRIIEIDGSKRTTFTCAESPNVPLTGDNPQCRQTKKEVCDFGEASAIITGDCPGETVEDTDLSKRESLYKASFTNRACPVGYEIRKAKDSDDGGYYECISVKCSGVATSVLSDGLNCGGCKVTCKDNGNCVYGVCEKTSPCEDDNQTVCNNACIVIGENNVGACNENNKANPFKCAQGYAHLDSDLTNGCETKLSDVHVAQTELDENGAIISITCENGYGNLDEKLNNGCETKLSDVHVEKVNKTETGAVSFECAKGYDDCDNLIFTGCETNIDNNNDHCGGCNQPCPMGSRDNMIAAECKNSVCNIYCAANYKPNTSNECEFDPSFFCCGHEFDNTCKNCIRHIQGAIQGTCTYDKEKGLQECSVSEETDCNVGYVLLEINGKNECVQSACQNDEDCKGESGKSSANICDKYAGKCVCGDLASPCSGIKQFCKESDEDAVCIECIDNDDCPATDGVKTVICEKNACSIKECQIGYHFSIDQCVIDDESNCYNQKCSEDFPYCSHEKKGCVQCKQNSHCESDQFRIANAIMTCNTDSKCSYACFDGYAYDPASNACRLIDDAFCEIVNDKRMACSNVLESSNAKAIKCNPDTEKCEVTECEEGYAYSNKEKTCIDDNVKTHCKKNDNCDSDQTCNCIENNSIIKGKDCKKDNYYCTCGDAEYTGSATYCKKGYTCNKTAYSTYLCSKQ